MSLQKVSSLEIENSGAQRPVVHRAVPIQNLSRLCKNVDLRSQVARRPPRIPASGHLESHIIRNLCQTEVRNDTVAFTVYQNVLGFDVVMNDAFFME